MLLQKLEAYDFEQNKHEKLRKSLENAVYLTLDRQGGYNKGGNGGSFWEDK